MTYAIRIMWDGDVPGLAEHRLSLAHFGPCLPALLRAWRRIATGVIREATDEGRFARLIEALDLQLSVLGEGSVDASFEAVVHTPMFGTYPLPSDLLERCGLRLFDALEREARGEPTNKAVRDFLAKVPSGVTKQDYSLLRDGVAIARVALGATTIVDDAVALPSLAKLTGTVVGLGFEPGPLEVTILPDGEKPVRCTASRAQVQQAMAFPGRKVRVMIARDGKSNRLLWLVDEQQPYPDSTAESRVEHLLSRWAETIRLLGE
jgi:hypothetical protein